jgi:hypothetical protein
VGGLGLAGLEVKENNQLAIYTGAQKGGLSFETLKSHLCPFLPSVS